MIKLHQLLTEIYYIVPKDAIQVLNEVGKKHNIPNIWLIGSLSKNKFGNDIDIIIELNYSNLEDAVDKTLYFILDVKETMSKKMKLDNTKDLKVDCFLTFKKYWKDSKYIYETFEIEKDELDSIRYLIISVGGGWFYSFGYWKKEFNKKKIYENLK